MARVIGNPFGELRGKLAGNVFSRNGSGAIVRQYAKPINPDTVSQIQARNRFRNATQSWQQRSPDEKGAWQEFAQLTYVPLRKINTGQYTGNQAYTALSTNYNANASFELTNKDIKANGVSVAPVFLPFTDPVVPPLKSVTPSILFDGLIASPLVLRHVLIFSGTKTFKVELEAIYKEGGTDIIDIRDENYTKFGIGLYISDVVKSEGGRPKNKFNLKCGTCPPMDTLAVAVPSAGILSWEWNNLTIADNVKYFPSIGQIVLATVTIEGLGGGQIVVGSKYVEIIA